MPGLFETWRALVASGEPGEIQARMRRFDGEYRWFLFRVAPLRDDLGGLVAWWGIDVEIDERKNAEDLLAGEKRLLEMGAKGDPLSLVLEALCRLVEATASGSLCSILLVDSNGDQLRHGAAPSLLLSYVQWIDGRAIALEEGPCASAASLKEPVIAVDFESNNHWTEEYRALALSDGLRACWSTPILSQADTVLGAFGLYYREPGSPTPKQQNIIAQFAHIASIAIERARTEEALRESEERFRRMADTIPEVIWITDLEPEKVLYVSPSFERIWGFPVGDLYGNPRLWTETIHPEDRARVTSLFSRWVACEGVDYHDVEFRIVQPNGTIRWIHERGVLSLNAQGKPYRVSGISTDITERRQAEEAVRAGKARFEGIEEFSHLPDVARTMGHRREVSGHQKNGSEFPDEASISKLDLGGELVFTVILSDITERKRAEEKIRQDERELRQIVEAIPMLIIVMAPDGSYLYANERLLEYTGHTQEDVVAGDFRARVFHPDDVERLRNDRQQALARGVPFEMEQRVRRKDGQYRWFLTRLNPLKDEQGDVIRWYATGTDIHDRKQAEERVQKENIALREEIDKTSMFEEIVGTSPALQKVLSRVSKVAPTDSTVLITGETGTGKELIARAIHKRSQRSARAFVSVNCAATPPSLIASELFGHEKGAFTGALQRRLGRFELAEGGTIFLDEIGELPMETQIALLRVLQEHAFERVGGSQTIRADVRVIAATNRDLQAAITQGTFRRDLFYRINVFPIEMPALRERKEDIPMLVEYFIDRYASAAGKKIRSIDKRTLALFQSYPWPGNIRELQNVIERSVILSEMETFSVDESWLSPASVPTLPARRPLSRKLVDQEKETIEAALAESKGKVSGPTGAAAKLGMPPSTLDSKIKALKINKYRFKE